jgi:chromosomal replication initiation ATPase DnaA
MPEDVENAIKVFVRVQPVMQEQEVGGWSWDPTGVRLKDTNTGVRTNDDEPLDQTLSYFFDGVFAPGEGNSVVYERAAKGIVKNVLAGINGTLFCYGQTGSGKSHTVFGVEGEPGIITNAFKDTFQYGHLTVSPYSITQPWKNV